MGKAYHISQRYEYKWTNNMSTAVIDEVNKFTSEFVGQQQATTSRKLTMKRPRPPSDIAHSSSEDDEGMFVCSDQDDMGLACLLAHTIDNADVSVFYN